MKLGYSVIIILIVVVGIFFALRSAKNNPEPVTENNTQSMNTENTNEETLHSIANKTDNEQDLATKPKTAM